MSSPPYNQVSSFS